MLNPGMGGVKVSYMSSSKVIKVMGKWDGLLNLSMDD